MTIQTCKLNKSSNKYQVTPFDQHRYTILDRTREDVTCVNRDGNVTMSRSLVFTVNRIYKSAKKPLEDIIKKHNNKIEKDLKRYIKKGILPIYN